MAVTDPAAEPLDPARPSAPALRSSADDLGRVWRLEGGFSIALRSGAVQHYSPDPEYATKYDHLIKCLNDVVAMPDRVALVFLDEMGYARWPEAGARLGGHGAAPPPGTGSRAASNRLWRNSSTP